MHVQGWSLSAWQLQSWLRAASSSQCALAGHDTGVHGRAAVLASHAAHASVHADAAQQCAGTTFLSGSL